MNEPNRKDSGGIRWRGWILGRPFICLAYITILRPDTGGDLHKFKLMSPEIPAFATTFAVGYYNRHLFPSFAGPGERCAPWPLSVSFIINGLVRHFTSFLSCRLRKTRRKPAHRSLTLATQEGRLKEVVTTKVVGWRPILQSYCYCTEGKSLRGG